MRRGDWRGAWTEVLFLFLAVALFLAGWSLREPPPPTFGLAPPQDGSLRVVTWNVGGSGQGGRQMGDELIPHLAATLGELEADLVALQEIRSQEQMDRLVWQLGEDWQAFLASGENSRVGLLARRGNLRARSWPGSGRFLMASYRLPRNLVDEETDDGSDDERSGRRGRNTILIAVLHADAFSAQQRNQSIGRAADTLERFPDRPKLLMGDLNLDLGLDKRQDLFSNDEHLDVETYNYLADRLEDAGRGSGSTAEPDRRLDYIFFSPRHFELIESGPLKGRRRGDMDHDPLVADLRPRQ